MEGARMPDPPIVGKVTSHSIALYWKEADHAHTYLIQERDKTSLGSFVTVYEGAETHCLCTGLKPGSEYHYRLKIVNNNNNNSNSPDSDWSQVITVSTTRQTMSCDNLHKAITADDVNSIKVILESDPQFIDIPDINGLSPLMAAAKKGRVRIVELLLSFGADVEYCNTAGKTSLMEASYHGHNECIRLLHSAGALWSQCDLSGMSVLHWAVDGEQAETVEYLINEGIPVDVVFDSTVSEWTPLLRLSATNGNTVIANILISNGADVNRRDKEGQTPLMFACLGGHKDLVHLLLKYNCCTTIKSKHDKTAIDFAALFGREDIIDMIKSVTRRGSIEEKRQQQQ